jgi:diadenosine tetraphosphate (Ap4A) HIT family hydrolase
MSRWSACISPPEDDRAARQRLWGCASKVRVSDRHLSDTGRILFQDILKAEVNDGRRIICETDSAIAFLPYFARYAYEVYVAPREPHASIASLSKHELKDFAATLKCLLVKLDNLWQMPFPYVLTLHQSPFRHANVVKMANLAQMVNVIAPIMTNKQGLYLQTTYFPIVEYGKQRGNTALDVFVSAPTYKIQNRPELKYLDVSSTFNAKEKLLYMNVLNRSKDKDLTTRIENQEGQLDNGGTIWEMNNADLKATNTFGADHRVAPTTRPLTVKLENNGFTYTFPAHSLTILKLKMR